MSFLSRQNVCREKKHVYREKNMFAAKKKHVCRDKHVFVATKDVFCRNKSMLVKHIFGATKHKLTFVATNTCLLLQNTSFVTTKLLSRQK